MYYYTLSTTENQQKAPCCCISDDLPDHAYCSDGDFYREGKGKVWMMVYDYGTCLISVRDSRTGKQVELTDEKLFGKSFIDGKWKKV